MTKNILSYPLETSSIHKLFELNGLIPYELSLISDRYVWGNIDHLRSLLEYKELGYAPVTQKAYYKNLIYPEVRESALSILKKIGDQFQISYPIITKSGKTCWLEEYGELISTYQGKADKIIGYLRYLKDKKTGNLAAQPVIHDRMTGLLTREYFIEYLDNLCKQQKRDERQRAVCYVIMITNLADIQQRKGPDEANAILSQLARQLRKLLRDFDVLARVDSNAFGLILTQYTQQQAQTIIKRIESLKKHSAYKADDLIVEVHLAVSSIVLNAQAKQGNLVLAKVQSQAIKNGTLSEIQKDIPVQTGKLDQSLLSEKSILKALKEDKITLSYQPVVNSKSRVIDYYECLIRLYDEENHLVLPNRFIPIAEKSDLIFQLDFKCLQLALQTLKAFPNLELSVNISGGTVTNRTHSLEYLQILRKNTDITNRLIIELTETVAIQDKDRAANFSFQSRRLGCRFSIDDFGAGFTSFRNLLALEVDQIKIDGSFIEDISTSRQNQAFVRMVIDLANTFSLQTVAEWINCEADAVLLTNLGIDKLQGYYLGIPQLSPSWLTYHTSGNEDKQKSQI